MVQSCLTLCDPMHCSPPGSSFHGVFQARILEWVAISCSQYADLSDPEIEPASLVPPAVASRFFPLCHLGTPIITDTSCKIHNLFRTELQNRDSLFNSSSVQFSSVTQSCPTLCDPMNRSTPGLPVHHQLPEFTQTHVHRVGDAIQPSLNSSSLC